MSPYFVWKTNAQVDVEAKNLAKGLMAGQYCPEVAERGARREAARRLGRAGAGRGDRPVTLTFTRTFTHLLSGATITRSVVKPLRPAWDVNCAP